jgi:hypothetical protein
MKRKLTVMCALLILLAFSPAAYSTDCMIYTSSRLPTFRVTDSPALVMASAVPNAGTRAPEIHVLRTEVSRVNRDHCTRIDFSRRLLCG